MKSEKSNKLINNKQYSTWLQEIKSRLRHGQLKAATSVNTVLLEFYWQLGADIVEKQKNAKWGSGFLRQLSSDLMEEFPDMKGFSLNNLQYIKRWYSFYSALLTNCGTVCSTIVEQPISQHDTPIQISNHRQPITILFQIPWGHNLVIISKCDTVKQAFFYVRKTIENNWSRSVLTHQIESGLYERQGKAIHNFENTLPAPQSDLACEIIKDPYNFDFLTLTDDYNERELQNGLIEHITKFLLELGAGFA